MGMLQAYRLQEWLSLTVCMDTKAAMHARSVSMAAYLAGSAGHPQHSSPAGVIGTAAVGNRQEGVNTIVLAQEVPHSPVAPTLLCHEAGQFQST